MELILNLGQIFIYSFLPDNDFNKRSEFSFSSGNPNLFVTAHHSHLLFIGSCTIYVDGFLVVSLYEYKHTIIRWTWYIVIRSLVVFLVIYSINCISIPVVYEIIFYDPVNAFLGIFPIIDIIEFVYYTRKFYLHLKSREKEIRLFYFDKKASLDNKFLRIHFKIATILVVNALFFSTLAISTNLFYIFAEITYCTHIPKQLYDITIIVYDIYADFVANLSFSIFEVLIIFNYLYIFIMLFTSHTETDRN